MAVPSVELLSQLELVMTEFFTGNTSNERKREIEGHLNNMWLQPDAWKHCLYCITHTSNEYVAMVCITALENLINRQLCGSLSSCQLTEIRQSILQCVMEKHTAMQNCVRNKLVKVVVDIARIQWPHNYPNFIEDIMLIGEHGSVVLCLVFLQVAMEELAIRDHQLMPHSRKLHIKERLHGHAPHMLHYVTGVLEKLLLYPRGDSGDASGGGGGGFTTTPPPSPSLSPHNPASPADAAPASSLSNILLLLKQRCQSHYQPAPRWLQLAATFPHSWDAASDNQAYVALNCLAQLMVWLPLHLLADNNSATVDIIFTYAALAALNSVSSQSSNTVSISAVSCIQEFLARPCIPPSLNPLLLQVLTNCCVLVHYLLSSSPAVGAVASSAKQRLALLHPTYLDKVTELVRVLVAVYFRRFEQHPQFNVEHFLALLFRYSFSQPSLDGYLDCLEIWSTLLDHLAAKGGEQHQQQAIKYQSVLELLTQGVLHKIQLKHNQCELEELDYDLLEEAGQPGSNTGSGLSYSESWDDQGVVGGAFGGGVEHLSEQSECQSFFSHNLDLLARLADIMPDKIMQMLAAAWQENSNVYLNLERTLQLEKIIEPGGNTTLRLSSRSVVSDDVLLAVHIALRDQCTLLQLLGRLATTFLGPQLVPRADTAMATIHRLVELGNFGMRLQLYCIDTNIELLKTDLIQIHCEILCSLRAWTHWLSQLYGHQFVETKVAGEAFTDQSDSATLSTSCDGSGGAGGTATGSVVSRHPHLSTCHSLTRQLLVLAASAVSYDDAAAASAGTPWVVVRCGVQLLLTVSVLVVGPVAFEVQQVQNLYTKPIYSENIPPGRVREMLYRALMNFVLLPWPSYSVTETLQSSSREERLRMMTAFLSVLLQPLKQYTVQQLHQDPAIRDKASSGMKECLCLVRSQLCQLSGADRETRDQYWYRLQDVLNTTIMEVMPLYCNTPGVLLEMVGTVMWCVGVVGGGGKNSNAHVTVVSNWIQKLVHLLTQPHYLSLALANDQSPQAAVIARFLQLLSLVLSDPSPGFKKLVGVVVATLDEIYPLVSQQPSNALRQPLFAVLRTLLEHNWKYFYRSSIQQPLSQSPWEEVQHGEQLSRILQAFGQSFMQADITVFRHNLSTLHILNNKFRLYSKGVFRPLLSQFITVLLQVLLHGSHALLQDEIICCVFHMASVELPSFHAQFLDTFLRNMAALTDQQRHSLREDFSTDTDFPTFSQSVQRMVNDLRYYRSVNGGVEVQ
uniref:Exportin-6-like n=4 Tax=Hirondellea gigas TaxID=1518452 RepID=A0A6A7G5Q6_9CRUS